MKSFDIWFNGGMVLASSLLFYLLWRYRAHKQRFWIHAGIMAALAATALLVFFVVFQITPYRRFFFMSGRFAGMCLFWYIPLFLLFIAAISRMSAMRRAFNVAIAMVLLGVYVYSYHIEPFRIEISRYSITDPTLAGLERPIVIAQVADFQAERFGPYEARVIQEIAAANPDIIAFCGDYITTWPVPVQVADVQRLFKEVEAACHRKPMASFAVKGDVEFPETLRHAVKGTMVSFLDDSTRILELPGARINVVGLDVRTSRSDKMGRLKETLAETQPGLFTLIVAHAPDYALKLADPEYSFQDSPFLALAGHTHGGQVRLPFLGPLTIASSIPRKSGDIFKPLGKGVLSVSRGIGMERWDAPRLRFLCRPELRFVTLLPPS